MRLTILSNRTRTITLLLSLLTSVAVVSIIHFNKGNAGTVPPIVQEVEHQGQVLDNHEDRIGNVEKDVSDLQNNTQTPPSSTKTVVREVTTPSPTEPISAPQQPAQWTPVVITSFQKIPDGENIVCQLNYSDGTSHSWLFMEVKYNQGVKTTTVAGKCDESLVGTERH